MPDPFAAVYANPDDDAVREEAAQKLKDPRGELITLQLRRHRGEKLSKADAAREKALLKAHSKEWLEPLGDVVVASTVKWERGFPVAARLNLSGKWMKTAKTRATLGGNTAIATLRALKMHSPNMVLDRDACAAIAMLPALRWLRELDDLPRASLVELAAAEPPFQLRRIRCGQQGRDKEEEVPEREAVNAALVNAKGLPHLVDLELSWNHGLDRPKHYPWLFQPNSALKTLRFFAYYLERTLIEWHPALTAAPALALERIELYSGAHIFLERTEQGWNKLTGTTGEDKYGGTKREIGDTLKKLPAITVVEVEGYPA